MGYITQWFCSRSLFNMQCAVPYNEYTAMLRVGLIRCLDQIHSHLWWSGSELKRPRFSSSLLPITSSVSKVGICYISGPSIYHSLKLNQYLGAGLAVLASGCEG